MPRIQADKIGGPNVAAFLDMIAHSEGTADHGDDGYNVLFGGKLFSSYADHPRVKTYETHDEFIHDGKLEYTTAAGRYQIIARNFDLYKPLLRLKDFSPEAQDQIAFQMIKEARALQPIQDGDFAEAVRLCAHTWASLPGAGYGQHENKLASLQSVFVRAGGQIRMVSA